MLLLKKKRFEYGLPLENALWKCIIFWRPDLPTTAISVACTIHQRVKASHRGCGSLSSNQPLQKKKLLDSPVNTASVDMGVYYSTIVFCQRGAFLASRTQLLLLAIAASSNCIQKSDRLVVLKSINRCLLNWPRFEPSMAVLGFVLYLNVSLGKNISPQSSYFCHNSNLAFITAIVGALKSLKSYRIFIKLLASVQKWNTSSSSS